MQIHDMYYHQVRDPKLTTHTYLYYQFLEFALLDFGNEHGLSTIPFDQRLNEYFETLIKAGNSDKVETPYKDLLFKMYGKITENYGFLTVREVLCLVRVPSNYILTTSKASLEKM
jgi:hypothetical protein